MKVCSNCQSVFKDDSLQFCLQCGSVLNAQTAATSGSGKIVAAILSGFALLALTVGGLGVYFFSRQEQRREQPQNASLSETLVNAGQSAGNSNANRRAREQTASVERLDNKNAAVSIANSSKTNQPDKLQVVASASSVRQPDDGNFYFPNFAFDNNPATAWCEGVGGAGANSWLQFDFGREVQLKAIKIMPGYFKNVEVWRKNNRVAAVTLRFSDGTTRDFRFDDRMEAQTIAVGNVPTSSVRITINEVYAGSADGDDTLISEVSFVAEP